MSSEDVEPPSLREAHRRATRERILDALVELLSESHPAAISVPDVAQRAGVSVATVYRHFPKKMDLFDSYAVRNAEDLPAEGDYSDPEDRLRAIAANFAKRESYYRVERFGPTIDEIRQRRREINLQEWYRAIDAAYPGLDSEHRKRLCSTLIGLFTPWTYLSLRDEADLSPDEAIEALVSTVRVVFRSAARDEERS